MSIDPIKLAVVSALAKQRHQHQEELEAVKDAHIKELRKERSAVKIKPLKRTRNNDRTEVYVEACKRARTPGDHHSVLDALRVLASGRTYPQLLGYDPDGKEFKWDTGRDEPPRFQTEKDALASIKRHIEKSR